MNVIDDDEVVEKEEEMYDQDDDDDDGYDIDNDSNCNLKYGNENC